MSASNRSSDYSWGWYLKSRLSCWPAGRSSVVLFSTLLAESWEFGADQHSSGGAELLRPSIRSRSSCGFGCWLTKKFTAI